MTYNSKFDESKLNTSIINPDIRYISYYSNDSEYRYSRESDISLYEDDSDYAFNYSREYDYDIKRVSEYDRSSLYTVPGYNRTTIDLNNTYYDENKENEDINPIIDLYMQSYIDESNIEPIMQLPLSPNQYMLMKEKWNKQLERELEKATMRSAPKVVSWSGFSNEFPSAPRNSNASEYSEHSEQSNQSKKSTRSWKSFFNKFSKKNKQKKQIPFYKNLIQ
jgi:hypothetical protein